MAIQRTEPPVHAEARRAHRVLRMISELHKRGYQLLRATPYMAPSGFHWRVEIRPGHCVPDPDTGACYPGNADNFASYSTGSGAEYFGWTDARHDDARALADKLLARFRWLESWGKGQDWAYAGWFLELLGRCEQGFLPIEFADYDLPTTAPDIYLMPIGPESRKEPGEFPGPPRFSSRSRMEVR